MKYKDLLPYLMSQGNEEYAAFSKSLSNSDYKVLGIKIPHLRTFIKEHIKDEELNLEDFKLGEYLEVDQIYFGLAIARLKTNKERFDFLIKKTRFARSWMITDMIITFFKKLTFDEYYDFFLKTYISKFTYDRRLAYVLGLKLYRDENIIKILSLMNGNEEYMVMMGEAWLLATMAIAHPEEVYNFLSKSNDVALKRKTISKISDSFRVHEPYKTKFKELRKNL